MKINAVTSALVGLAMATYAAAVPTTNQKVDINSLPSTLSDAVRADLATRDPSTYTLYNASDSQGDLEKRATVDGVITRCSTSKCLAITFDDGPYVNHKDLVDKFDAAGMKATFFVNGNNFRCIYEPAQVSALRYSYARGHQICSHTWSHPNIAQLSNAQLDKQVGLVEDALHKILGVIPSCIRAPYGSITPAQVSYLNSRWGLQVIGWNADSGDANGESVQFSLNVYRGLRAPKHAIVLNHETVGTTPSQVIPEALKIVRQNGYSGSQTVASTTRFHPYKVVSAHGKRDASWTCADKPGPGEF